MQQVLNIVADVYISRFRTEVGLSDEQFIDLSMILREMVRRRFMLAQRRDELIKQQEQMIGQNTSEEEYRQLKRQLDDVENQLNNIPRNFFVNRIEPRLTRNQSLLAQQFNRKFEQDLKGYIERAVEAQRKQMQQQQERQRQQQNNATARPNAQRGAQDAFRGQQNQPGKQNPR
jgi:hypothetical protein